jgi:AraC family transcriptional regulator
MRFTACLAVVPFPKASLKALATSAPSADAPLPHPSGRYHPSQILAAISLVPDPSLPLNSTTANMSVAYQTSGSQRFNAYANHSAGRASCMQLAFGSTKMPQWKAISGVIRRSRAYSDFSLLETWYAPGSSLDRHYHLEPILSFSIHGDMKVSCAVVSQWCPQGSLLYLAAGEYHANSYPHAAVRLHLRPSSRIWQHCGYAIQKHSGRVKNHVLLKRAGLSIHEELMGENALSEFAIFESLLDVLGLVQGEVTRMRDTLPPRWLLRLREFLADDCAHPFHMKELVLVAGHHPAHISRAFKRHFGKTMTQFIRERRILRAAQLLRHDCLPLSQLALDCGFYDQSHFTHAFAQFMGEVPSRYRARSQRRITIFLQAGR